MQKVEADEDLAGVPSHYRLVKRAIIGDELRDGAPRHPLEKDVEPSVCGFCAEIFYNVVVLQLLHHLHSLAQCQQRDG